MCECCDYIAARGGHPDDPKLLAEFERLWRARTRAAIAEHGFTVVPVENEWPPFAYTIGLWTVGHPELVLFGLDHEKATGLLHLLAEQVCDSRRVFDDGDEVGLGDWRFKAFRLPNPGQVVLRANLLYKRRPQRSVPALQLVYPDVHDVWPWEPDCHLFPGQQPMPGEFAA